jgi:hypothetical protein
MTDHSMADHRRELELTMADHGALSVLGFVLSGVAATVIVIAYLVVQHHIEARPGLDRDGAVAVTARR